MSSPGPCEVATGPTAPGLHVVAFVSEDGLTQVAVEILRYLSTHPDAQDDLEGVTGFWLLERKVSETRAEVEAALRMLVDRGLVETVEGADGRVRYRRRAGR